MQRFHAGLIVRGIIDGTITVLAFIWPFIKIISAVVDGLLIVGIPASLLAGYFLDCITTGCPTLKRPDTWGIFQPFVELLLADPTRTIIVIVLIIVLTTLLAILSYLAHRAKRNDATSKRSILVRDLQSSRLGGKDAATFPYIPIPIQKIYDLAIQTLQQASSEKQYSKRGILIMGESNAGKTRLALKTMKEVLPHWPVLEWRKGASTQLLPHHKHFVLFIDDLQIYLPDQLGLVSDHPFVIRSEATIELEEFLETLFQIPKLAVIVVTCRSDVNLHIEAALYTLLDQLETITIPSFNIDQTTSEAKWIIDQFEKKAIQEKRTIHKDDWDGTLGSLVQGLSRKRSQYQALQDPVATILKAMKLLREVGIPVYSEKRLRATCSEVFGERELQQEKKTWLAAVKQLKRQQLVAQIPIEVEGDDSRLALIIRQDIYFEKVVIDYPESKLELEQDFENLRKVLVNLRDIQGLIELSITLSQSKWKRYRDALTIIENVLAISQDNVNAWYLKGILLGILQPSEALTAFDQLQKLTSDKADVQFKKNILLSKGLALAALKQHDEALTSFNQALSYGNTLDKRDADIWFHKGEILYTLGRYEETLEAFDTALTIDSENVHAARALILKGDTLLSLQRYEDAFAVYEQMLNEPKNVQNAAFWFLKGYSLYCLERYDKALEALEQALILDPQNVNFLYFKGKTLIALGDHEEALRVVDQSLAIEPNDTEVNHLRSVILFNLGRYEESVMASNRALDLDPNKSDTLFIKAQALFQLYRFQETLIVCDQALNLDPINFDIINLKITARMILSLME
jgi:tetratricopeptide (TPR) repeat protein